MKKNTKRELVLVAMTTYMYYNIIMGTEMFVFFSFLIKVDRVPGSMFVY